MMEKGLPKSWVPRCEVVQFMNFKVVLRRRSQKTCFSIIDFLHLLPHRMYTILPFQIQIIIIVAGFPLLIQLCPFCVLFCVFE